MQHELKSWVGGRMMGYTGDLKPFSVAQSLRLLADKVEAGELRPTNVSAKMERWQPGKIEVSVFAPGGCPHALAKSFGEIFKPLEPPRRVVSVECDCSCAEKCPQGKTGMAAKCRIWKEA